MYSSVKRLLQTLATKSNIESKCSALKSAIAANNASEIKSLKEELQKAFYDLSAKVYQQANPNGAGGVDPSQFTKEAGNEQQKGSSGDDDIVDADFTEV